MRLRRFSTITIFAIFATSSSGCLLDGLFGDDEQGLTGCDPYYGCPRSCAFEFTMTFDLAGAGTTDLSTDFFESDVTYGVYVESSTCDDVPTGNYGADLASSVSRASNLLTVDLNLPLEFGIDPGTGALSSAYAVEECDMIYFEKFKETFVSGTLDDANDRIMIRLRDEIIPCDF